MCFLLFPFEANSQKPLGFHISITRSMYKLNIFSETLCRNVLFHFSVIPGSSEEQRARAWATLYIGIVYNFSKNAPDVIVLYPIIHLVSPAAFISKYLSLILILRPPLYKIITFAHRVLILYNFFKFSSSPSLPDLCPTSSNNGHSQTI